MANISNDEAMAHARRIAAKMGTAIAGEDTNNILAAIAMFSAGMLHQTCRDQNHAREVWRSISATTKDLIEMAYRPGTAIQ